MMVYRAIGVMSGSSLDGLDIVFSEFQEVSGKWEYSIRAAECFPYEREWEQKLQKATGLSALDYQLLHTDFGHYIGKTINRFIEKHHLQYQVQLITSHGHTTFHVPSKMMTAQIGDGAAIAAETGINTVSDLRAMDLALGGQGAPIVPIGEKLLLKDYSLLLNLGGIANVSVNIPGQNIAFDVCAANRVLNLLAAKEGKVYDENGVMASTGDIHDELLSKLNGLAYYNLPYPKSLANDFGTDTVFPLANNSGLNTNDAMRTYVEHIAVQVNRSLKELASKSIKDPTKLKLLITGGGAHNVFLTERIKANIDHGIEVIIPDPELIDFKEALIMALIGVLRWREEVNVLATVTGASRDSIGGAVWIGQD
jgi:anhydro-N-acetylmuramic acid kinase